MSTKQPKARVLAYYLPQFHPIPENDLWWGKGFTEWTNVGKAKPLFPGHYQPRVPADLGYYDLRVPGTRKAQADMAREYGVEGFVYWHYWFGNGKRLLERPFNEVLASGEPDFPFALAWANETWSGFAHGVRDHKQVLIEQKYPGDEDYIAHFYEVLPAFKDKRYIQCEGKPIFIVYHMQQIPNTKHFVDLWQKLAKENGLEGIYFIAYQCDTYGDKNEQTALNIAYDNHFDAINIVNLKNCGQCRNYESNISGIWNWLIHTIMHKKLKKWPNFRKYTPEIFKIKLGKHENIFPSIIPGWDHTPRTGKGGYLLTDSTPELFEQSVQYAVEQVASKPYDKRFVFIKSWNEWAEGNHMEPDLKYGKQYLEALKKMLY